MKLTWCSFVDARTRAHTTVILEGEWRAFEAAEHCLECGYIGQFGEFEAEVVPDELAATYAPYVNQPILSLHFDHMATERQGSANDG